MELVSATTQPAQLQAPAIEADNPQIPVRPLTSADASAFRSLRLESLEKDGRFFKKPDDDETRFTLAQWQERAKETPDQCWFGMFAHNDMVGIARIYKTADDTAEGGSLYVIPDQRQHGVADQFVHAALDWLKPKTEIKFLEFHAREDNMPSRHLCEVHLKGEKIETVDATYGDGSSGPAFLYRIPVEHLRHG